MLYNVRSNNDLTNNFASYLINEYVMLWCNWPVLQATGLADCLCVGFGAGPSLATPQRTGRRRMLLVQRLQLHVQRPPHYAQPRPLAPRQTTIRRAARRPGLPHLRQVRSLLLFFKPTSTKPHAGKLGQTYKIMVATAIYSVTMVSWKDTAFTLCRAMERRWKRNVKRQ